MVRTTFYFAEGTCRPGFDTYFCVQNPGAGPADVTLTFMKGDGTTSKQNIEVAAHARTTVLASSVLGTGNDAAHDFSTRVECTNKQSIIVERPMYFDYQGYSSLDWNGGHDVVGFTP